MDDNSIRQRIAELRKAQGLTQTGMASRLSIDRNTYADIENGPTAITNKHLPQIAEILGISEERLLLGYEPCHPGDSRSLDDVKATYNQKIRDINDANEEKIAYLKTQIMDKDAVITALNQQLATKDDVIALLRKRKKA